MAFFSCFSRPRPRPRPPSTKIASRIVNADVCQAAHVVNCEKDSSSSQEGLKGLPKELSDVLEALNNDSLSEKKRSKIFKKMSKIPKPTVKREIVISNFGGKTEPEKEDVTRYLGEFCEKGSPLDQYDILHKIGSGSYGDVYLARDKQSQEEYAIKQCSPAYADTAHDFYLNETVVLSFLSNPNIIRTFGAYYTTPLEAAENPIWRDIKVPYLVMELMDCSLGDLLDAVYEAEDSLPEDIILYVMREILSGVHFLHKKGIFHRDLKSDNVLLSTDGFVKIVDFGLSKRFNCPEEEFREITGTSMWLAPEICRLGLEECIAPGMAVSPEHAFYTYKADIWALGIVLIELLDTEPPHMDLWHTKDSKFQIKKRIALGPPSRPVRKVSLDMNHLLDAMLCKDPAKRWRCEKILDMEVFKLAATQEDFAALVQSFIENWN